MICKAPGPCGRMNAFQRLMYQWTGLHPYNATHTYKIAGPLRLEKLCEAIREAAWRNGVGMVHVDRDGISYRHQADGDAEVQVLPGGQDPERRLGEHVARELNRPFDRPVCRPWRFSVIDAGPAAHYVSTTYDHWVADSVAARLLLRHILGSYCGLGLAENRQPLELYPETYREAFGRRLRGVRLAMAVARAVRRWRRDRSAWQAPYSSATHMAVDYQLLATAPGTVGRLCAFAHELGASVHDVLLAALARALGEFLPRRSSRGRSRELSLGSIVDARPDVQRDLGRTFGMFLAYYLVRCGHDATASLAETTRRIAGMTRPIKQQRRYLDSVVNMKFASAVWPHLSEGTRPHFMRKALPMSAGISNVRLREPWLENNRDRILGCTRSAPTGPMLPLVLAPTTLGDEMTIGVTYRVTGFSRAKISGILEMLLDQIEHTAGAPRRATARHGAVAASAASV